MRSARCSARARSSRARQGRRHVPLRAPGRCRPSTGSSTSRRCCATCPPTSRTGFCSLSTVRTSVASPKAPRRSARARFVIDVDHHHDNSRFGDVNLVVPDASSTAEVIRDILRELDVDLTPQIAEALYVGLVTDTGRFQYTNTTPKALRLAAELVEAGADVHGIFQHVYETVQFAKLKLLARALDRAARSKVAGLWSRTCCATTSPRSAPRSRTPRGSSTVCALSRVRRWSR